MKIRITIVVLLFGFTSYSQEKNLAWGEKTCEAGTEDAKKDVSKGRYFCGYTEHLEDENPMLARFYATYLKEKYGIISISVSSIVTEYDRCYSNLMEKMIAEKFGADIFEKSLKEAKERYYEK